VNRGAATRSGRIGVDLGGTKIEIVALDEAGAIAVRRRVASPSHDYAAIVETIGALVEEVEAEFDAPCTVGVGTPGAVSRTTELMKNANSTVLIGRPLERDLRARLGREVRIANDANCFALSEASDGAAAGLSCVFGAILGTGVGGGIVVDGRPLTGRNAIAGEWGHNPLPWAAPSEIPGPRCYCGKNGCIEAFLSGPSLVRDARANGIEVANVQALLAAADAGDAAASLTFERYFDRLARALATILNVLDPEAVVLGGGVSNLGALYEELPRRLPAYVFSDTVLTPVLRPAHGDSSGVRGAAWLWPSGAKPPACKIS
jgi:fructokinase